MSLNSYICCIFFSGNLHIVVEAKAVLARRDFFCFCFTDIMESIGLRMSRPSRFESDFFKVYFYMYFDPKRSLVACTGVVISKLSADFLPCKNKTLILLHNLLWP